MNHQPRPYAVFDIDGTLIRWQLYHALADAMAKKNLIDSQQYQSVIMARNAWKARSSLNSFNDYEQLLITQITSLIAGVNYEAFKTVCLEVVSRYQSQVYTFTRDLIASLKQQNYLVFAISASPIELVKLIADYYEFNDYAASSFEVIDNQLTGNEEVLYGPAKTVSLKQMIKLHKASQTNSIAVGDTIGDIGMLELADEPIAFNPSSELYDRAINKGWKIVIERKNMVYHLNYNHGQYILATATNKSSLI